MYNVMHLWRNQAVK